MIVEGEKGLRGRRERTINAGHWEESVLFAFFTPNGHQQQ